MISGCSNNKSIGKILIRLYILPFLSEPSIAKLSMSGGVWMGFEGVWMMSRWCLRVSGEASIPNLLAKTMLSYDTQILHFLSMPCTYCIILSYFLRCLYCVWECLGEV